MTRAEAQKGVTIAMAWARFHKDALRWAWGYGSPITRMYHESMLRYNVRVAREYNNECRRAV